MRSATSLGGTLPWSALHVRCVSSCCSRSSPAWPRALNDARITSAARALTCESDGAVAQPARTTTAASIHPRLVRSVSMVCASPLDRRARVLRAVRVVREKRRQGSRGVRSVDELGEALLAEAVVEPPINCAQLALGHPVGRPRGVRLLRAVLRGQVG